MYLVGNSFHVSFKWVVIISTKQEAAHTQSAKVSTCYTLWHFGDWSLITGRGATNCRRGGGCEVLPLQKKGGADFFFSRAEGGGGTKSCEVVLTWEFEILSLVIRGGRKKFSPFKVRLWLLGVVSRYHGKIYSFHFSTDILIMIMNH